MSPHSGGTVRRLLQIKRGSSRLAPKPEVVGQSLSRFLTRPALQSLSDAPVQGRSPGKAKIMNDYIPNQLMGKLVGVIGAFKQQSGLAGGLDPSDYLIFASLALKPYHREKQPSRCHTPSYCGDPKYFVGNRR
jgi:hypothetical protein